MLGRLRGALRPIRAVIVMYHRIADCPSDPWGLCVSPANFEAQVAALARTRTILPMDRLVAQWSEGTLPDNAVGLTFDDGYRDNLELAAPVLAAADAPATLFLATAFSQGGESYWWEELAAMVLDAPPTAGTVQVGGQAIAFDLPPREPDDDRRGGWRAWNPRTARERLHYRLWEAIRALPPAGSRAAMSELEVIFGAPAGGLPRAMNADELRRLTSTAPFAIGGHTATHADLTSLGPEAALAEITAGREEIAEVTGHPPTGFAYPYGRLGPGTPALVEAAGFAWACTTESRPLSRRDDALTLPRIGARNVGDVAWLR